MSPNLTLIPDVAEKDVRIVVEVDGKDFRVDVRDLEDCVLWIDGPYVTREEAVEAAKHWILLQNSEGEEKREEALRFLRRVGQRVVRRHLEKRVNEGMISFEEARDLWISCFGGDLMGIKEEKPGLFQKVLQLL